MNPRDDQGNYKAKEPAGDNYYVSNKDSIDANEEST